MTRSLARQWKFVLGGWGVYALYMSAASYFVSLRLGSPVTLLFAAAGDFSYTAVWVLLTPLVLWLVRRFRFEKERWFRIFLVHLAASIAIAILHKGIHGIVFSLYRFITEGKAFSWELQYRQILLFFDYGIQIYWIILLLDYVLDYYLRFRENELKASQLETRLAHAQLNALKMQLQPHFLFNTLNAISVLIRKDPQVARNTLGRLSDLLRFTLENVATQEVPLRAELEYLDRYLNIEKTRFEDRLTIRMNILPESLDAQVPTMILQPLVENAIKHGVTQRRGPAIVEVNAYRTNGALTLQVIDNGKGLPKGGDVLKEGVGLSNTRARLQQLYGPTSSLTLADASQGGVVATVTIPWHVNEQKNDDAR